MELDDNEASYILTSYIKWSEVKIAGHNHEHFGNAYSTWLWTRRKPPKHRENMQTAHTGHTQDSNPQPRKYEANVLITKSPCLTFKK